MIAKITDGCVDDVIIDQIFLMQPDFRFPDKISQFFKFSVSFFGFQFITSLDWLDKGKEACAYSDSSPLEISILKISAA